MTNRKRKQLEEAERRRAEREAILEADRKAAFQPEQQQQPTVGAGANYYGAVQYGEMNGYTVPVSKGQVQGIQLPPIIQPISLSFLPFDGMMGMGMASQAKNDEDEDYDDFDGDDWF